MGIDNFPKCPRDRGTFFVVEILQIADTGRRGGRLGDPDSVIDMWENERGGLGMCLGSVGRVWGVSWGVVGFFLECVLRVFGECFKTCFKKNRFSLNIYWLGVEGGRE